MVLFRAECGCKFESCRGIDSQNGPLCGCTFAPCGRISIARDQTELDRMDNEKLMRDFTDFLDTLPPGDPQLPEMPQGDPLEQRPGHQEGPREEEPAPYETIESMETSEGQARRQVEQLSVIPSPVRLRWHVEIALTRSRKRESASSPPSTLSKRARRSHRGRRGVFATETPREEFLGHRSWESSADKIKGQPESECAVRVVRSQSRSERAIRAAKFRSHASHSHAMRGPHGGPSHEAPSDIQHHGTREEMGADSPLSFLHCHQAPAIRHQLQTHRMRNNRQRNKTHPQQQNNEHRQRLEATQRTTRQGRRSADVNDNDSTETASRNIEQAYMLLNQYRSISQHGSGPTLETARQERDRIMSRFWETVTSRPPQRLQDSGPPFDAYSVSSELPSAGASGHRNAYSIPLSPPSVEESSHRNAQQAQSEGYAETNSRNFPRFLAREIYSIAEEAEDESEGSGERESGGRGSDMRIQG